MPVRAKQFWRIVGPVSVALLVLLMAVVGWWIFVAPSFDGPDNHVAATDSRVCPGTTGNNDPLVDVTRHFGLVLPSAATHVVFTASVGGMQGESDLELRFTTTPVGLARFLSAGQFDTPTATTQVTTGEWLNTGLPGPPTPAQGPCGLEPPTNPHMVYSQDGQDSFYGDSPRSLAVDLTDPEHPTVWIAAADL